MYSLTKRPEGQFNSTRKIEKGLVDRLDRSDLDHSLAIRTFFDRKAEIEQDAGEIHPGLPKGILRRKAGGHSGQLILCCADIEFGPQGLPQTGQHGEFAQAGGLGNPRGKRHA